jgi:hypothetical protein
MDRESARRVTPPPRVAGMEWRARAARVVACASATAFVPSGAFLFLGPVALGAPAKRTRVEDRWASASTDLMRPARPTARPARYRGRSASSSARGALPTGRVPHRADRQMPEWRFVLTSPGPPTCGVATQASRHGCDCRHRSHAPACTWSQTCQWSVLALTAMTDRASPGTTPPVRLQLVRASARRSGTG